MMTKTRWVMVAGLALVALAGCAGADPGDPGSAAEAPGAEAESAGPEVHGRWMARLDKDGDGVVQIAEPPARMQDKLAKADSNGDGNLSKEELRAGFEARGAEHFAKMDKNGDGAVDASEVGEHRWSRMQAADADADGRVTKEELRSAFEGGKLHHERGEHRGHGMHKGKMLERLDANKDGALDASEVPAKIWSHLQQADTDGNGSVTKAGLEAAHAKREAR